MLYVAKSLFKNEVHVLFRHMKAKNIYYILMSYYKMQFLKKVDTGNPWATRNKLPQKLIKMVSINHL